MNCKELLEKFKTFENLATNKIYNWQFVAPLHELIISEKCLDETESKSLTETYCHKYNDVFVRITHEPKTSAEYVGLITLSRIYDKIGCENYIQKEIKDNRFMGISGQQQLALNLENDIKYFEKDMKTMKTYLNDNKKSFLF